MEFNQLGISTPILKVLEEESYSVPTPIQEKTIPSALKGRDILGLAQTGTGKTAAFSVPTLQLLAGRRPSGGPRKIRALVLTPTRELALQVHESFTVYGRYLPLKSTVIFGGVGQDSQVNALKGVVDILVATPGRLQDLINQGYIDISQIEFFILDEADRMLDMGFIHDVRRIIKYLPAKKQTMLFSATMPKGMEGIIADLLVDPVEVSVTPVSSTVDTIQQYVYFVDKAHKIDLLTDYLLQHQGDPVLIFARTKGGSDRIVRKLSRKNIKAMAIHGDKSQNARVRALESFKSGTIQALIATDIASRGIDINELKHVINYDLPEVPETYVHRIGRTGRAGNEGVAVSLCSFPETGLLKDIEKLIKKKVEVLENEKYPMVDLTVEDKSQKSGRPQRTPRTQKTEKPERAQAVQKPQKNAKSPRTPLAAGAQAPAPTPDDGNKKAGAPRRQNRNRHNRGPKRNSQKTTSVQL